jgi:hypothetical protein
MAILTSLDSSFLPRYSGVRPTIKPATKTWPRWRRANMPYRPGADAAEDHSRPTAMLTSGTMPAERHQAVMHGIDGAAGRVSRDGGVNSDGTGDAEAHLLALHIAARLRVRWPTLIHVVSEAKAGLPTASAHKRCGRRRPGREDAHRRKDRPTLALVLDHPAKARW